MLRPPVLTHVQLCNYHRSITPQKTCHQKQDAKRKIGELKGLLVLIFHSGEKTVTSASLENHASTCTPPHTLPSLTQNCSLPRSGFIFLITFFLWDVSWIQPAEVSHLAGVQKPQKGDAQIQKGATTLKGGWETRGSRKNPLCCRLFWQYERVRSSGAASPRPRGASTRLSARRVSLRVCKPHACVCVRRLLSPLTCA